jgi:hypothetical protein
VVPHPRFKLLRVMMLRALLYGEFSQELRKGWNPVRGACQKPMGVSTSWVLASRFSMMQEDLRSLGRFRVLPRRDVALCVCGRS